ncbi:VOC family protein [Bacteroides intestinalis]|uniref:Glyoxalase family protein n=1 Tax=Bacteroides intestinalis TaxID=329854 RepID=A0A139LU13_9BACE|nr:VOC family protein [Bacteroides intestinalis]KXT54935.1 glyoxalase family protein [Bacteroides intestinalis]
MKKLIAFFEIPATDFHRAIDFYETVLNMKLPTCECEEEKMAFFTEGDEFVGAVSYASDFLPSEKGVLIHFNVDDIEPTLETILKKGGKVVIPRTKIEAEGRGYFAVFVDTEGNRVGIYADK